jgi:RNA polymerase sigma-B factor
LTSSAASSDVVAQGTREIPVETELVETEEAVEQLGETALEEPFEIEDVADADVDYVEHRSTRSSEPRGGESEFHATFALWRETGDPELRDRLILMHRNLVSFLARRFADRGEGVEDIVQQGMIGLIYALDHFDPTRGVRFATFATPTIIGEIRRYFRDKTRGVRIPRRVQELHQTVTSRIDALTQQFDRSPTYWELAHSLNLPVEDVIEALEIGRAMETVSLDEPMGDEDNTASSLVDHIGDLDPAITRWDERSLLQAALHKLPEKHRTVLHFAYFENLSQVEIAGRMNVSQMHVSRLLRAALAQLRQHLEEER